MTDSAVVVAGCVHDFLAGASGPVERNEIVSAALAALGSQHAPPPLLEAAYLELLPYTLDQENAR